MHPLTSMFRPESIAVVGASEDRSKWGYGVFNNITHGGFKGRVYPVNPNAATVLGAPAYRSLRDIPERVDLAFIVIPAPFVLGTVKDAIETGVRSLIVITAGFGETGLDVLGGGGGCEWRRKAGADPGRPGRGGNPCGPRPAARSDARAVPRRNARAR